MEGQEQFAHYAGPESEPKSEMTETIYELGGESVPFLHGTRGDSAPVSMSVNLTAQRPDLVQLETFDTGRTITWNADREHWMHVAAKWLLEWSDRPSLGVQ